MSLPEKVADLHPPGATMSQLPQNVDLASKLDTLKILLEENIIGQQDAIDAILGGLERYYAYMHDFKRPIASFLFLGPTGTGKSYLVEKLAEIAQYPDAFIKIDCAEFSLDQDVAKLYGSPPGYVGSEQGSFLTKLIDKVEHPENGFILLLDEIEKANSKFFDSWLSVMDKGRMMDSKGKILDFTRSMIFMTSNVGASHFSDNPDIGFRPSRPSDASVHALVINELKKSFRPEFLNRLTSQVFFYPLTKEQEEKIFSNQLAELNSRLARYLVRIELSDKLSVSVRTAGFSREYGARELKRAIGRLIEQPLAKLIIHKTIGRDSLVYCDLDSDGKFYTKRLGDYPVLMEMKAITTGA